MKKITHNILLLGSFLLGFQFISAQTLFVDNQGYTAQNMVQDWFDSTCVSVSNIAYTGDTTQIGFFDGSQSNIGLNAGFLITSGSIWGAVNQFNISTVLPTVQGDSDLGALTIAPTEDAAIVEFDLVPSTDTIRFKYVFASHEYPTFVGTSFNDVFAFFLSGPNPAGGNYVKQNLAKIPNSSLPVCINNVNSTNNSIYYVDNTVTANPSVSYGGFTTPLDAWALVVPDSTYHIKIGVADAGDEALDSGVFLSIESLCGSKNLPVIANGSGITNGNTVTFQNASRYASQFHWDFGDGATSNLRMPTHTYANLAGQSYTVTLTASNFCCSDTYVMTVGNASSNTPSFTEVCHLYPNPANGKFIIELKNQANAQVSIEDMTGKVLVNESIQHEKAIDLSNYGAGIYLLRLESEGNTYVTKVINQ